jgi:hypothetical protein
MQQETSQGGGPMGPLDCLKIVPFVPDTSSYQMRWVGLEAVRWRAGPAVDLNPPAISHHSLLLFFAASRRTVHEIRGACAEFRTWFTHSIRLDWILPGILPTGRRVELPFVVIVQFEGDKLAHEHLYWDQASVLVQVGLLDRTLPVRGGEIAAQVLNPTQPMNELIRRSLSKNGHAPA